MEGYFVVIKN